MLQTIRHVLRPSLEGALLSVALLAAALAVVRFVRPQRRCAGLEVWALLAVAVTSFMLVEQSRAHLVELASQACGLHGTRPRLRAGPALWYQALQWIGCLALLGCLLALAASLGRRHSWAAAGLSLAVSAPLLLAAYASLAFTDGTLHLTLSLPKLWADHANGDAIMAAVRTSLLPIAAVALASSGVLIMRSRLAPLLASSRSLGLSAGVLVLGLLAFVATRSHARAPLPRPRTLCLPDDEAPLTFDTCRPPPVAPTLSLHREPAMLERSRVSPDELASALEALKRNQEILHPNDVDPKHLLLLVDSSAAPEPWLPYLQVVRDAGMNPVLAGAARSAPVLRGTPYGDLRREQACVVSLRFRPDAPPLRSFTTWSDVAASAENGAIAVSD